MCLSEGGWYLRQLYRRGASKKLGIIAKRGDARRLLQHIARQADKNGVAVRLLACPSVMSAQGTRLMQYDELTKFYARFGFRLGGKWLHGRMLRKAQ